MESKSTMLELPEDNGAKPGDVRALFSTLKAIDSDGDYTLPGAFESGAPVRIAAYGHNSMGLSPQLPTGRGEIFADDEKAIMRGRFFLDSTIGKDTYVTIKEMGDLQEWSYEYDVLDSEPGTVNGQAVRMLKKLKVHGVTPVYLGAGVGTQTLEIKSDSGLETHGESVTEALNEFVVRVKNRAAWRAKEGRSLSTTNRNRLSAMVESLDELRSKIAELLDESDPEKSRNELVALRNEFLRREAQINGVFTS